MRIPFTFLLAALLSGVTSADEAHDQESVLLSGTRQLTFAGKRAGEGYFNVDGSKLIFQSERDSENPFFQIFLMDLETGDTERISPGHGKTTCSWIHPGGKKVMFASTQGDPDAKSKQVAELKLRAEGKQKRYSWDYDAFYEIYEYDLETKKYRNLTKAPGYDAEGAYSPDGSKVVFASNRLGYSEAAALSKEDREWFKLNPSFLMDLFIMNADGSGVKQLTKSPGYDGGPFFSADGKNICWRRFNREGDQAEIYSMKADGSGEKQLTHLAAMSWAPFFHPSGEYLIFGTNLNGFANFELYLVDAAGLKEPVRVTWTDGFDGLPAFSPDGTRLSWTSKRSGRAGSQIFLATWNHQAALEILKSASPRGTKSPPNSGAESENRPEARVSRQALAGLKATVAAVQEADLRHHIEFLASPELKGRMTGTPGEQMATSYVAQAFKNFGLVPFEAEDFFHSFEFTAGVDLGKTNELSLRLGEKTRQLVVNKDWRPLSFSQLGAINAKDIVFAGYGIEMPKGQVDADGSKTPMYSSYYHLAVKDKWVLMLRFIPENVSDERRRQFSRFSSMRYKAMIARQKGAKGVIFVSGPNTEVTSDLVGLSYDASMADSGIAVISVGKEIGAELLAAAGENLKDIQATLDKGEMMMGIKIPGASLNAKIDIVQQKQTGRNVVGRLRAKDPAANKRPALILGAHVDHLGTHGSGSRATGKEASEIHFGADDNASGVAALLEIAQYLSAQREVGNLVLHRDVVFAAWSGEEIGLIGSSKFVQETARKRMGDVDAKLNEVFAANLNMDMIGRLDQSLVLQGIGSSKIWPQVIERRNAPIGLPIKTQSDAYLPTDATSFYLRDVPILNAFTGAHEDYHTPNDTADKINYPGTEKITKFMVLVARGLATAKKAPDYVKVERPEGQGRRANLRAYLGTVPDYSQGDLVGVKLSGATKGGPADTAGIKGGDVVVSVAGKEVKNIYDYTYVLESLKVGVTVKISVLRKGQKMTLDVTPGSRQ
ncbi:MAG: M28 family peptidase [Roseibacillus sp.]|nr:M28 family peptidase [Roseibacillus sp.]